MIQKVFSIWDYLVFSALLLASSMIGVFFAWTSRNAATSQQFFTGNRKLALFPVTMSLVASFMSTNTLLGVPAEIFQVGTQFVMQIISITVAVGLASEVFMPVYYDLELISVNEYLFLRFNSKWVKLAGTIGFLFATVSCHSLGPHQVLLFCLQIPYMAVVLYGPAVALSSGW